MIVEMEYFDNASTHCSHMSEGIRSLVDASEIASAFFRGENVLLHYGNSEDLWREGYVSVIGVEPHTVGESGSQGPPNFVIAGSTNFLVEDTSGGFMSIFNDTDVDSEGKLCIGYASD